MQPIRHYRNIKNSTAQVKTEKVKTEKAMSELKQFSEIELLNQSELTGNMQLFALIRSLESLCDFPNKVGDEKRFGENQIRFTQTAFLNFPDRQINALELKKDHLKVDIKGFGLFGPNGALPTHITEQIYERRLHQNDKTFNDFVDIFHNRLIALFYKAWRDAQDVVSLEGKDTWHFSRFIASILGIDNKKDYLAEIHHYAQFYYSNLLLNQNMPLANLKAILTGYFNVPVEILENVGQWIDAKEFSTELSRTNMRPLGQGLLIGDKIFDATQKIRLKIGPIHPKEYLNFLRGQKAAKKLVAWIEQYTRHQLQWDVEFIVDKQFISQQKLGDGLTLGFTSWIGQPLQNPNVIIPY